MHLTLSPQDKLGMHPQKYVKTMALAAVLIPFVFFGLLTFAGLIRPGYNPIQDYGSYLEVGPHAWIGHVDFVLVGLLEMAFALGLRQEMRRDEKRYRSAAGPALLCLAGIAMILIGLFVPPPNTVGHTIAGTVHARAAQLHSYGMIVAFGVLAYQFRINRRWRPYAGPTLAAAVLATIPALIVQGAASAHFVTIIGLVQRTHYFVLFAWLAILGLHLWNLTTRDTRHGATALYHGAAPQLQQDV